MLEITESYFDSPTPVIAVLDIAKVKGAWKISDDILKYIIPRFDLYHAELDICDREKVPVTVNNL